jgi:hypothetical protein
MNTANTTRGSHHHASDAVCSSFILLVLRIDPPMALCTRDASASMYVCIDVRKHRQCANTHFFTNANTSNHRSLRAITGARGRSWHSCSQHPKIRVPFLASAIPTSFRAWPRGCASLEMAVGQDGTGLNTKLVCRNDRKILNCFRLRWLGHFTAIALHSEIVVDILALRAFPWWALAAAATSEAAASSTATTKAPTPAACKTRVHLPNYYAASVVMPWQIGEIYRLVHVRVPKLAFRALDTETVVGIVNTLFPLHMLHLAIRTLLAETPAEPGALRCIVGGE